MRTTSLHPWWFPHPIATRLGRTRNALREVLDAVRALPGVESAGTVDALPFSGENHGGYVTNSETGVTEPNSQTVAEVDVVSADYFTDHGGAVTPGPLVSRRRDESIERYYHRERRSRCAHVARDQPY